MVGYLQIIIYLLAVYLVYKGFEIFQIALVSNNESASRKAGLVLGVIMIIGAFVVGAGAVAMSEMQAASMSNQMNSFPKFP